MRLKTGGLFSHNIYFIIFTFSGFSGLIYESIWTHYLKLFLGHAAYAQTLVLVIFMGGMAVGAWWASWYGLKIGNLLIGYAIIEGVIGLLGIFFHDLFIMTTEFSYSSVIPWLDSQTAVSLFMWTLAALLIFPQSVLLGATFPFMSAGVIRLFPENPGHKLSVLYFTNSFGASVGVLASGFLLIQIVGLPGTVFTAGVINVIIAVSVLALAYNARSEIDTYRENDGASSAAPSGALMMGLLLCAGITGCASFLYEIGWIRMLTLVLSSSTHAFELMLSAFILGLAIGGFWIKSRIDRFRNPARTLGVIQLAMGALALLTLVLYNSSFDAMSYAIMALKTTWEGYELFNLFSHGLAVFIMLPTTICAGMTLPLITYHLMKRGYGEMSIGRVYSANTVGAITGIVVGTQLIMPELGLKNMITAGAALDILLGLAILLYLAPGTRKVEWGLTAAASLGVLAGAVVFVEFDAVKMASGVYRNGVFISNGDVVFHKDGKTASVDLIRTPATLTISTNGKPDASIGIKDPTLDEPTMILLAALPWSIHEKASSAAVIGIGSGLTSHTLLNIPSLAKVDTIEIEPAMFKGAAGFGKSVANTFNSPRSHIHIEDAKAFFTSRKKKYDLVISEPSNPWVSGVAGLFSYEYYRLARNYINDDGLFAQWLHYYEIDMQMIASVIKALSPHFYDYAIYLTSSGDIVIVASKNGEVRWPGEGIFKIPTVRKQLGMVGIFSRHDLSLRYLGRKKILDPLFNSYNVAPNSDYYPTLEYGAARTRFLQKTAKELLRLRTAPAPIIETLEGRKPPASTPFSSGAKYCPMCEKAHQAKAILAYFTQSSSGEDDMSKDIDIRTLGSILMMKSTQGQCDSMEVEKVWTQHLSRLAFATLPYLSPGEMAALWDEIENTPCFSSLPVRARNWAGLYKAVGMRDFERVIDLSELLLPPGVIKPSGDNNYLLMVSMLAHIANNDNKAALVVWNRYKGKGNAPIEIRLLVTNAITRRAALERRLRAQQSQR